MTEQTTDLPCCNVLDVDDPELAGTRCTGTMELRWPVYVCDTCHSQCGCWAHLACETHPLESDAAYQRRHAEKFEVKKDRPQGMCQRADCDRPAQWTFPSKDPDGKVVRWVVCDEDKAVAESLGIENIVPISELT